MAKHAAPVAPRTTARTLAHVVAHASVEVLSVIALHTAALGILEKTPELLLSLGLH